jgi:hypothetical protein
MQNARVNKLIRNVIKIPLGKRTLGRPRYRRRYIKMHCEGITNNSVSVWGPLSLGSLL